MTNAQERFADTDVHITIQGKQHLSAAIGSRTFTEYVCSKVQTWSDEIKRLAKVANHMQPTLHSPTASQAHYSYFLRTVPDVQDLLFTRKNELHQTFIPALTGRPQFLKLECDQLGPPVRLGGMGLTNPVRLSTFIPCISVSDCPTNSSDHHTRDQSSC